MFQDGQINFPFILITGTITFIVLMVSFFYFIKQYQRKKLLHIHEKEQLQSQFRQTLLQSQLEIREQTLKNISQEIHDNIGQALSLAKLNLNTLDITNAEELQQKIDNSKELVSKAIQDLRDISRSFNTDNITAIGLVRAIEYELEMIRRTGAHQTDIIVEGVIKKPEPQKELILFRIVQEVFQNIIKHAEAKTISVIINYSGESVHLKITDDGKGFSPSPLNDEANTFGLGIRNMNNRANLIGGSFDISSEPGKGTSVEIAVTLNNTNNNNNL